MDKIIVYEFDRFRSKTLVAERRNFGSNTIEPVSARTTANLDGEEKTSRAEKRRVLVKYKERRQKKNRLIETKKKRNYARRIMSDET